MKSAALVNESDLREWLGYKQQQQIINWLKARQIPFDLSRGKVVTTASAIDGYFAQQHEPEQGFQFA